MSLYRDDHNLTATRGCQPEKNRIRHRRPCNVSLSPAGARLLGVGQTRSRRGLRCVGHGWSAELVGQDRAIRRGFADVSTASAAKAPSGDDSTAASPFRRIRPWRWLDLEVRKLIECANRPTWYPALRHSRCKKSHLIPLKKLHTHSAQERDSSQLAEP